MGSNLRTSTTSTTKQQSSRQAEGNFTRIGFDLRANSAVFNFAFRHATAATQNSKQRRDERRHFMAGRPARHPIIALAVAASPLVTATPIPSTSARINSMTSGQTSTYRSE
ncbi:hypothetical protein [Mycobacterium sp.]|uniref:hypothetical protein n=1 Tax=Mycobacterium sp. TaxID=1785 RepID=UPI003F9CE88E